MERDIQTKWRHTDGQMRRDRKTDGKNKLKRGRSGHLSEKGNWNKEALEPRKNTVCFLVNVIL